ncbi:MAG: response regulator [Holophaga sp.]|jgi:CheY-like chemotaxis protein
MAIFGFGKDRKEGGPAFEQVLAYLEDAQRTRAPFTLVGPRKTEAAATLQAIDEAAGVLAFQVQGPLAADKGARIEILFLLEGLRLGAATQVVEVRSGLVQAALPEALELRERRCQPRARLNPKEGATLTALTGLFEGVGITGVVENLAEGGARVRVEKALNLKGEKRLPLGTALFPPGQEFMVVKLNKVPKCPAVMELEGRAVFLDGSAGGLVVGLAFNPPRADVATALRNLVASRTSPIPSTLPPKARRKPEATAPEAPPGAARTPEPPAPKPAPAQPAAATPPPSAAPTPPQPAAANPPQAAAPQSPQVAAPRPPQPAPPVPAAAPAPAQPPRNEAVLRLRKRSRAVVALVPTPAAGDLLKDFLQEEGYGRVLVTSSRKELKEFLQQPNLAVLFLDGNLGTLDALQLASDLAAAHPALPPTILAVEEVSAAVVLAARRHGVAQILIKPYTLDAAFSELLNQLLV